MKFARRAQTCKSRNTQKFKLHTDKLLRVFHLRVYLIKIGGCVVNAEYNFLLISVIIVLMRTLRFK